MTREGTVRTAEEIDRALASKVRFRAVLVERRRCAPWMTPPNEDVAEVREELDVCIRLETERIEALLAERDGCRVDA